MEKHSTLGGGESPLRHQALPRIELRQHLSLCNATHCSTAIRKATLMFQSLPYQIVSDGHYIYQLIDSEFQVSDINEYGSQADAISTRVNIIITEYQKRNLPVAPNVACFYRWWSKTSSRFSSQRNPVSLAVANCQYVVGAHPKHEYGTKYYPCVVRQIKQLGWGKKS